MEIDYYKKVFGDVDFNSLRGATFKNKIGNFITIARLIYNGYSHNFGTIDGAVVIMNNYMMWRFIAPVGRWSHDDFEGKSLSETLSIVCEDAEIVPVPAWDDFVEFLADNDNLVILNQIMFGKTSSIKIAYKNTDLPLLSGITDFPSFGRWLCTHMGEAGNEAHETFHTPEGLTIPIDMYESTPVTFTLKTPTEKPVFAGDIPVLKGEGVTATYGQAWFDGSGSSSTPFFRCVVGEDMYVYTFAGDGGTDSVDGNHVTRPIGAWGKWNGTSYERYDMEANPVVIPYTEGMEWSYLAKAFTDIQWETVGEKKYRVKKEIDLDAFAGSNFHCYGEGSADEFIVEYMETESVRGIALAHGVGAEYRAYYYVGEDSEYEGVALTRGWNVPIPDDSEAGFHCEPYDMDLVLSVVDGQFETNSEELCMKIVDLAEDATVTKEEVSGTIHFVFTF